MPFLSTSAAATLYCRRLLLPHIIRSSGRSSRRSSSQLLQIPIHYDNSIRSIRLFSTSPSATTSTLTSPDNDSAARVSNRKPRVVILGRYVLLFMKNAYDVISKSTLLQSIVMYFYLNCVHMMCT